MNTEETLEEMLVCALRKLHQIDKNWLRGTMSNSEMLPEEAGNCLIDAIKRVTEWE